jgi:hypothetical protein
VNLAKVLSAVGDVHSEGQAKAVPEALEFFVFGKPLNGAVDNSKCHADPEDQ